MVNEKDLRVFGFFRGICNNILFKGFYEEGMSFSDLKKELSDKDIDLSLVTQDTLTKICFLNFKSRDIRISLNAVKGLINEAIKERYLFRWGDENRFLVTKEFLDYIRNLENPYIRFDIEDYEFEEIETKKIRCPYCEEQTKFPIDLGSYEVNCEECEESFKIITGIVKNIDENYNHFNRNNVPLKSITLLINDEDKIIDFPSDSTLLVNKKDRISFIYKRGWLYETYSEFPNEIVNLTAGQIYVI